MNGITFFEGDGLLKFLFYKEGPRIPKASNPSSFSYRVYKTSGIIPKEVRDKSREAINEYATNKVREYLEKTEKELSELERFAKNPDFPIEFNHKGVTLKGKIVSAEDNTLIVRLISPHKGETSSRYGFATAWSGHYIFDNSSGIKFSDSAIEEAKKRLALIFDEENNKIKNVEIIALAEQLNKDGGVSAKKSKWDAISHKLSEKMSKK